MGYSIITGVVVSVLSVGLFAMTLYSVKMADSIKMLWGGSGGSKERYTRQGPESRYPLESSIFFLGGGISVAQGNV